MKVKVFVVAGLLAAILGLTGTPVEAEEQAVPGAIVESTYQETVGMWELGRIVDTFYENYAHPAPRYAVDEYRLRMTTTDTDGASIEVVAQFFVPRTEAPDDMPIYVFGAGSSGLVNKCAPSQEDAAEHNIGSYRAYMLTMATQGYISILPDYAGFNDPDEVQPYYVAEMAGRVLLDAGRAVYNFFDPDADYAIPESRTTPTQHVFIAGYSQGGQSVFAAKDMAETYAPELPVAGILGYAPVVNMQNHMIRLPQLAPYRMYAYQDYYGEDKFDLETIFDDHWLPTMEEDVLSMCVFQVAGYYSALPEEMYKPAFLDALMNGTLADDYPSIHHLLEINNPGFVQNDIPALILQGGNDSTIPMDLYRQIVDDYCEAGNHIDSIVYPQATHFDLREVSYEDAIAWMDSIVAGDVPENECDQTAGEEVSSSQVG